MYVSDLITDFLESLEIEKGRSTHTVDNYALYLARFNEIASEDLPEGQELKAKDINQEMLRKYRLKLNRFDDNPKHEHLSALTILVLYLHAAQSSVTVVVEGGDR